MAMPIYNQNSRGVSYNKHNYTISTGLQTSGEVVERPRKFWLEGCRTIGHEPPMYLNCLCHEMIDPPYLFCFITHLSMFAHHTSLTNLPQNPITPSSNLTPNFLLTYQFLFTLIKTRRHIHQIPFN